mmetsp:Transcript_2921/g.8267  ORF Transcript_2921/g.8267 Transcript_2921/m.8267 type:complete len:326 (-) Transcript_2921:169-1146(-)
MELLPRPPAPRQRPLASAALLSAAALALLGLLSWVRPEGSSGPAFLLKTVAPSPIDLLPEAEKEEGVGGPLDWLHYKVIIASHSSYPVALMIGFNCFGNVLLRKECAGQPYPNWLFGYLLGFVCYTYPGAICSDLFFKHDIVRAMSNNNVMLAYTFWFILIQTFESVYKLLTRKWVFIGLTTWWLADATRASMCFLERAVTHQAVFSRGVFQCFLWCGAGPILRVAEASIRGAPIPPLDKVQPNTFNAVKYPLVMMWMTMMGYLLYMAFLTDCKIFSGGLTMVECGKKHDDVFAALVYLSLGMHIFRTMQQTDGKIVFDHCMCGT